MPLVCCCREKKYPVVPSVALHSRVVLRSRVCLFCTGDLQSLNVIDVGPQFVEQKKNVVQLLTWRLGFYRGGDQSTLWIFAVLVVLKRRALSVVIVTIAVGLVFSSGLHGCFFGLVFVRMHESAHTVCLPFLVCIYRFFMVVS